MTPANPENVPLDKIPAGWRLLYKEEYKKPIPIRVWYNSGYFSKDMMLGAFCRKYTYITPDLPDNGQPWHAHKPGDPAPVQQGTWVDLVCRNGDVIPRQNGVFWDATTTGNLDVLFYRLHDPAPIKTESPTFEANGHTWFRHTPGDPCPCDKQALVHWINANELSGEYYHQTSKAGELGWSTQVGWRYADQPSTESPPPTFNRILSILIAAGHITEEQVEQARKLVKP